ncbi:hypothetical protein CVIC12175_b0002 (plasmid) [Campylobacter vicugnae]|uniref:hypothetical protein n=1 Tax=Campylobacter vicugnae TaxID=1660076 RepID=UPI000A2FFAFB|nr:hypothetical protein [Campylobacter sp. RM12175]ARR04777.1 hypothetical protein CVIC12175_b0002 [Campylobacter sp. RM12175]
MTEKKLTDLLHNLDLESKDLQSQRENLYAQLEQIETQLNDIEKKSNSIKLSLMKSWGSELNLDIKIDENLLLSDDELLPKIEQTESENSSDDSKKDLDTNLADLSELMKDM